MSPSESASSSQDVKSQRSGAYHSSPELAQRTDLLRHLIENSNLIPLVRGAEGIGKSTFIHHLLELAPENWIPVELAADVMLQPAALLANLARQFDLDDRGEELMERLVSRFDDLRHDGLLPVIIVDDAHLLPEASIIVLLRLHERSEGGSPLAQILLFAQPEIDDLLKTPQLRVMNLQSLQMLDMPVFTLEQTERFLEHLLTGGESRPLAPISQVQIEKIHRETGGLPGLIKQRASVLMGPPGKPAKPDLIEFILSGKVLGGGVALILVLLGLIYQDSINALFSGDDGQVEVTQEIRLPADKVVPLALPDEQAEPEATPEVAQSESSPDLVQDETVKPEENEQVTGQPELTEPTIEEEGSQPQAVEPELPAEQQQASPENAQSEATQEAVAQAEPTESDAETEGSVTAAEIAATPEVIKPTSQEKSEEVAAPIQTEIVPKQESNEEKVKEQQKSSVSGVSASAPVRKEQQLKTSPVVSKSDQQDSKPIVPKASEPAPKTEPAPKREPEPSATHVKAPPPETKVPVAPDDRPVLNGGRVRVPAPVEERSTMLERQEVPTVKSEQATTPQAQKKTVPAPRIAQQQTPKVGAAKVLREEWLLRQGGGSYTIQLVGMQDESGIAGFLRRYTLAGPVAYYRTSHKGGPWFPVLYGVFSDRQKAKDALNRLPENLRESGAWIRSMSSVHKEITPR